MLRMMSKVVLMPRQHRGRCESIERGGTEGGTESVPRDHNGDDTNVRGCHDPKGDQKRSLGGNNGCDVTVGTPGVGMTQRAMPVMEMVQRATPNA